MWENSISRNGTILIFVVHPTACCHSITYSGNAGTQAGPCTGKRKYHVAWDTRVIRRRHQGGPNPYMLQCVHMYELHQHTHTHTHGRRYGRLYTESSPMKKEGCFHAARTEGRPFEPSQTPLPARPSSLYCNCTICTRNPNKKSLKNKTKRFLPLLCS